MLLCSYEITREIPNMKNVVNKVFHSAILHQNCGTYWGIYDWHQSGSIIFVIGNDKYQIYYAKKKITI